MHAIYFLKRATLGTMNRPRCFSTIFSTQTQLYSQIFSLHRMTQKLQLQPYSCNRNSNSRAWICNIVITSHLTFRFIYPQCPRCFNLPALRLLDFEKFFLATICHFAPVAQFNLLTETCLVIFSKQLRAEKTAYIYLELTFVEIAPRKSESKKMGNDK